jgi:hypothetical protein
VQRARVPEAMPVGSRLVLPGVAPVRRGARDDHRCAGQIGISPRRLDEDRAIVALAQSAQREVVRVEVIHPGGQTRELARDEVEVDVMERAGVRVGAEQDLSSRIALPLRDPRRQIEDAGQRGEVWSPLAVATRRRGGHGWRDRLERWTVVAWKALRKWDRLQVSVDLERQRLVRPVEEVAARVNAALAVLGGLVILEGGRGVSVGHRFNRSRLGAARSRDRCAASRHSLNPQPRRS